MALALIEHAAGRADELSLQALALARELAGDKPVEALLVGPGAREAAAQLGAHGVSRAHVAEDERLEAYAPGAWARCVTELVGRLDPRAVVGAGTNRGNEVLAHVAARLELPFAANCTGILPGEPLTVTRVRWGGSLIEEARVHGAVPIVSVAPHTVAAVALDAAAEPAVEPFAPALEPADVVVQVVEHVDAVTTGISLAEAKVVVSGGRGVGSAEGFEILEELAGMLDAAVGCSRVVTSAGWRPHTDQVGQTGTKVSPDLYIACGISGATQHIAGCKGAKKILAINSDAEAPILNNADYAVIGDLTEIIPAITAELRKVRS
ncbi:MAG TPA: electron transfer flavoprotein subunit alpha/FixB family protein [Solirubrobacteraceae bacterium]|nr:electron transfer flavoprotein subunit alpha/FixB family protein [Solirubrobacteraceae bacterium]